MPALTNIFIIHRAYGGLRFPVGRLNHLRHENFRAVTEAKKLASLESEGQGVGGGKDEARRGREEEKRNLAFIYLLIVSLTYTFPFVCLNDTLKWKPECPRLQKQVMKRGRLRGSISWES